MREQLTRARDSAKNLAGRIARKKQIRSLEFLLLPRRSLMHVRLNWTDAAVQAAILMREKWGSGVTDTQVGEWLGLHRTTVGRSRRKLAALQEPYPDVDGFLKVPLDEVRRFGLLPAMALAQVRNWGNLGLARRFGASAFWIGSAQLGRFVGCCAKTAWRLLQRLKGQALQVEWSRGRAAIVRLLGERERPEPVAAPVVPPPLPAVVAEPRMKTTAADFFLRKVLQ